MDTPSSAPKLRHSWLGIASCVLSIIALSPFVLLFFVMIFIQALVDRLPIKPGSTQMGLDPWFIAAWAVISAIALGLGIAGLRQPDRKIFFPLVGCVLSIMTEFLLLIMFVLQML